MPSLILRLCESPSKILTVPKDSQLKWTLRHVEATPKGPSFARETTRFLSPGRPSCSNSYGRKPSQENCWLNLRQPAVGNREKLESKEVGTSACRHAEVAEASILIAGSSTLPFRRSSPVLTELVL